MPKSKPGSIDDWVQIAPGVHRDLLDAPRTFNGYGDYDLSGMTPKQRYRLNSTMRRWACSHRGLRAAEYAKKVLPRGELGKIDGVRFIITG